MFTFAEPSSVFLITNFERSAKRHSSKMSQTDRRKVDEGPSARDDINERGDDDVEEGRVDERALFTAALARRCG